MLGDKLRFLAEIDIPAVLVTLGLFLANFEWWARKGEVDSDVDLMERLPKARFRVVALFSLVLLLCWLTSVSFLWVAVLGIAAGMGVSLAFGGQGELGCAVVAAVGYLIREWSFGFPELILQPPKHTASERELPAIGSEGIALSPLRPCGEVEIGGEFRSGLTTDLCWMLGSQLSSQALETECFA